MDQVLFTREVFPEYVPQQQAADACVARVAPGVANWTCSPGFVPTAPGCDAAINDLLTCYGV